MDDLESLWTAAQIRRAEWATMDRAYHLLPQQHRHFLKKDLDRFARYKDDAVQAYQAAMKEPEQSELDHLRTCDYSDERGCAGTEVFPDGVLKDVGGSMVCPRCLALSEEDAEPQPRDYRDEVGS